MAKDMLGVDISGIWSTKSVTINGRKITLSGFIQDLKADAEDPGESDDILMYSCYPAKGFSWGDTSPEMECLSAAICFYLEEDWVMMRYFIKELQKLPQTDTHVAFTDEELNAGYWMSEELFAQEFGSFMKKLGAVPFLDLDREKTNPN